MDAIQQALTNINTYARSFRQLGQEPAEHVSLHMEWKEELREIAAIIHPADSDVTGSPRTVVFWKRSELAPTFINLSTHCMNHCSTRSSFPTAPTSGVLG